MEGGSFRVDLTYHLGSGTPTPARYVRAVDKLAGVLPTGSKILSVRDISVDGTGMVEVVASVLASGRSAAQALHEVARAVEFAAIAAAGTDNIGECHRAVVEFVAGVKDGEIDA